jgi:hypothetical protein
MVNVFNFSPKTFPHQQVSIPESTVDEGHNQSLQQEAADNRQSGHGESHQILSHGQVINKKPSRPTFTGLQVFCVCVCS